jgi:hypothetical protein
MTDAELFNLWFLYLGIAVLVVVIAAALLLAVLSAARSIERGATAALGLVEQIRDNTQVIWALQDTNEVAGQLRDGAVAILGNAGAIAQALHEGELRRGGN